jgi:DHA1 family bicyclomycin/chloramphenicol resistance-like MFS transporter
VKRAYVFMFAAAAGNLAYALLVPPSIPWAMIPIFFYAIGFAMAMPSMSLITLDLFPTRRGMAASLQGFVSGMVNTLNAGLLSPAVSHSPRWLAVGMLAMMLGGVASWFAYLRLQRPVSEAGGSDSPA